MLRVSLGKLSLQLNLCRCKRTHVQIYIYTILCVVLCYKEYFTYGKKPLKTSYIRRHNLGIYFVVAKLYKFHGISNHFS